MKIFTRKSNKVNTLVVIIVLASTLLITGCGTNHTFDNKKDFFLKSLSQSLEDKNIEEISMLSTKKGARSIFIETDSLNNIFLTNQLLSDLKELNFFDVTEFGDSICVISLGQPDVVLGATHGYVVLKKVGGEYKLDIFKMGK